MTIAAKIAVVGSAYHRPQKQTSFGSYCTCHRNLTFSYLKFCRIRIPNPLGPHIEDFNQSNTAQFADDGIG
jgi:hypothetical protein